MKKFDIVILTERSYVQPKKIDGYISNVLLEDDIVKKALEEDGIKVIRLSWDDPDFDWSSTKFILFRTTWDYFDRFNEFSKWLNKVSSLTTFINSEALIRWNLDKHYLLDLKEKGVHICESYFIEQGETLTLRELTKTHNLKNFVLKPCISGGGRHTYKITSEQVLDYERLFKELIAKEAYILQPFQNQIVTKGEISLMLMNGEFTHAVLKKAKPGDFRVQDDFGGTVHKHKATPEEIQFAKQAINACIELPTYARVDIFTDNNNQLAIAELELIEPELWFRNHPKAASILSKKILKLIRNKSRYS